MTAREKKLPVTYAIRLAPEGVDMLELAARLAGKPPRVWAREALMVAARRQLAKAGK